MSTAGSSKFIPDLTGNAPFQIGQIFARAVPILVLEISLVVNYHDIQDIARLPLGVGHHLHDVVSMRSDAEAVRRDDGMNGIVIARHGAKKGVSSQLNN